MTNTERYEQIIINLTELLSSKNLDLYFCREQIKSLEKKLKQVENKEE